MANSTCIFDGCSKSKILARGLCSAHYQQVRQAGLLDSYPKPPRKALSLKFRFERIGWTETLTGCWEWNGGLNNQGYGQISKGRRSADGTCRPLIASRVAWELNNGEIPADMCVCHICDNRKCVNPDHLFLGTKHDNNTDMAKKRRSRNGERRPQFKLADFQVEMIKALYSAGGITQYELAKQFGVNQSTISLITSGLRRKYRTYSDAA